LRVSLERTGVGTISVDDLTAGDAGVARKRYDDLASGAYRLRAEARAGGEPIGEDVGVFVVEARSLELARARPRPDLLRAISRTTDGKLLSLETGLWDELEVVDPDIVEIDRRRNIELWDNAWALVAAILLLGLEWALRRRSGYL
jgi:hypothetical protein